MGLFEKLFGTKRADVNAEQTFQLLTGYQPAFATWHGSIYESELIRAAVDACSRHASKLQPVLSGSAKPNLQNRLRIQPNSWQTWSQFLYRMTSILNVRNTCFIVPTMGEYGETNGIYTIAPRSWELVEYHGEPFIRFKFDNAKTKAIELRRVGILTRFQYESDLFGEDNAAMQATLDLITMQSQAISESAKNSATYRFYAVSSNFIKDEDLAKERKRFDRENLRDGGGVLLFPNTYKDVKQVTPHTYSVDADQMRAINTRVFDYFGVNEDVLQNKCYGDSWLAFYEGAIEPLAIQLSEVMSRMLFTERERTLGNKIFFTANRLQYMSNADKLNVSAQMADRGLLTRNEIREIWQLPPFPAPYGDQIPARGEYYSINEEKTEEVVNDEES